MSETIKMSDETRSLANKSSADRLSTDAFKATIGSSVSIKGEISGDEDILIEGGVEGVIRLEKNTVTIGKTGKVKAHIYGSVINIEGEVIGDIFGGEHVVVHKNGRVLGNITAPRISLQDGARIKGTIDTESAASGYDSKEALRVEKLAGEGSKDPASGIGPSKKKGQDLINPLQA